MSSQTIHQRRQQQVDGVIESAERAVKAAQEALSEKGASAYTLNTAAMKLEALGSGIYSQLNPIGRLTPEFAELAGIASAAGATFKAVKTLLPVYEVGMQQEWGLREFISPIWETAQDLMPRLESALADARATSADVAEMGLVAA